MIRHEVRHLFGATAVKSEDVVVPDDRLARVADLECVKLVE